MRRSRCLRRAITAGSSWLTDVLPDAMADVVKGRVERGIQEVKEILELNEAEQ
jgi:hypothetical protein